MSRPLIASSSAAAFLPEARRGSPGSSGHTHQYHRPSERQVPAEKRTSTQRRSRVQAQPTRVLVAEDDDEMRRLLAMLLRRNGYDVITCGDGLSLLELLGSYFKFSEARENCDVDLVISDIRMPGLTGLEILEAGKELEMFPPVVLITAFGAEVTHEEAAQLGARACFDKPFDIDEFLATILRIVPPAL